MPDYTGCAWPIDEGCLGEWWDNLDQSVRDRSVALAGSTLRRLTGYRVGGCPVTVLPNLQGRCCFVPTYGYRADAPFIPGMTASGTWVNNCGCHRRLSRNEVSLPAPVGEVIEVRVDGVALDPSDYRHDGHLLVWQGAGDAPWPASQTEDGTFTVTYRNSYPVDGLGAYAAGVLAGEFAKACSGGKCRLPATVTAVTRQGVSFEMPAGAFPEGRTGLREVDTYIALWNPSNLRQEATVWTPDQGRFRVTR